MSFYGLASSGVSCSVYFPSCESFSFRSLDVPSLSFFFGRWPITFGATISGVCAGVGGVALNNIFRRHYQLRSMARMSTYLPIAVLPGMAAMVAHSLVTSDILLMNTTCVVCTQTKAMMSQLFLGIFYPCLIAPAACLSFAVRYNTYAVPPIKTHYKHIIIDISTTLKKKSKLLTTLCAFQCIVTFFLLHTQMNSVLKIQRKLSQS